MVRSTIIFSFVICLLPAVWSMECYVCKNQEGNRDKCIKTTMQCLPNEYVCLTKIDYKTPPYWMPFAERAHFLEKNCTTEEHCLAEKERAGKKCQREWYMDWECVECCKGELCNYYATLDARSLHITLFSSIFVSIIAFVMPQMLTYA